LAYNAEEGTYRTGEEIKIKAKNVPKFVSEKVP